MDTSPASSGNAKEVALVLSSGGPRGFAYIGAIEELSRRGYHIHSVAGCSIGSLVGGIWAAGGLPRFKEWLFNLDNFKVMKLLDFKMGKNYLVRGEKVIEAIKTVVPDVRIEDMEVPFCAVATDVYSGQAVHFTSGNLFEAIRSSISIPSLFRPMQVGHHTLIDGGIVNTMPYDCVRRKEGDILVGFDVNCIDTQKVDSYLQERSRISCDVDTATTLTRESIAELLGDPTLSVRMKLRCLGKEGDKLLHEVKSGREEEQTLLEVAREEKIPLGEELNYYSLLSRSFSLMNHTIARLQTELYRPDVLVKMNFDTYSTVMDYARGEEIAVLGAQLMGEALDLYEKKDTEKELR